MSSAGWYPDPGKQAGMYRYWDGQAWSAALSPTPEAAPPHGSLGGQPGTQPVGGQGAQPVGGGAGTQPLGGGQYGGNQYGGNQYGGNQHGQGRFGPGVPPTPQPQRNRGGIGLWIAAIAGLIVIVVVAALVVRGMGGGTDVANNPGGRSTRAVCPNPESIAPTRANATRDGRVYGGKLSYAMLPPPWAEPTPESRVPFGRNAWHQNILVEQYGPGQSWVASVLVAELHAGDGFYTPQAGSEIVVKCIVGAFYGDAKVDRQDRVNRATTVQGKEAWLVESHLTFNIPNLKTKGELAIVLIVQTSENTSSIYYASIPDTSPQWEAPARQAMAGLRVDG
ncbi:DUF2510 domain-containing protein [Naumannella sp. ID2617S]|uniref:DUF2510 domain-containing protein n=1 Tax=Enemella dayhoffiae TaxID=2016507 RepID=A0A255H590_9ACTN|nr:DUF2510 domain-containing protein [Enemella dayhoffiae]NNG20762.1 DUF2510 domain-containing protein [Naumannella sp. ID2617S]OYO22811.1 hypothetical protein CGZ93_07145 [Enemella dayhoffiae]